MLENIAKVGAVVGGLLPPGSTLLAYTGSMEGAGVAIGSIGGTTMLVFACRYLFKLMQYKDQQHRDEVETKNAVINALMDDLRKASGKCKSCDFVKASNREFLDNRKAQDNE